MNGFWRRVRDLFANFSDLLLNDIAIDLGTSTTLIYIKSKDIMLNEPSIVAIDQTTGDLVAAGNEAKRMLGKTPDQIRTVRPMKDGVIADFEMVEMLLRTLMGKVEQKRFFVRPRVVISVPSGITQVEKRAVRDSLEAAGAREIYLISEPIAAAGGIGLPVDLPVGNMVIDIGGGTTEVAVIALSGIVSHNSVRIAGDEMDDAIIQYIKKNYNVIIGEQTAEDLKIKVGSAVPLEDEQEVDVKGRDLVTGIPKTITITTKNVREAIKEPISLIIEAIHVALERTPPELAADIIDRGIYMSGGGSLLKGLSTLIQKETGLPIFTVDNAVECVVLGAGKVLEDIEGSEKLLMKVRRE